MPILKQNSINSLAAMQLLTDDNFIELFDTLDNSAGLRRTLYNSGHFDNSFREAPTPRRAGACRYAFCRCGDHRHSIPPASECPAVAIVQQYRIARTKELACQQCAARDARERQLADRERRLEAQERQKQAARSARASKRDEQNAAVEAELARRRAAREAEQAFYDMCRP